MCGIYGLDVMLGCASLEGTDPRAHASALSFMAQNCAAPPEWRVRRVPERYIEMKSDAARCQVDAKARAAACCRP